VEIERILNEYGAPARPTLIGRILALVNDWKADAVQRQGPDEVAVLARGAARYVDTRRDSEQAEKAAKHLHSVEAERDELKAEVAKLKDYFMG